MLPKAYLGNGDTVQTERVGLSHGNGVSTHSENIVKSNITVAVSNASLLPCAIDVASHMIHHVAAANEVLKFEFDIAKVDCSEWYGARLCYRAVRYYYELPLKVATGRQTSAQNGY